jgi:ribonucleoside-diphosphate reductase beta chain
MKDKPPILEGREFFKPFKYPWAYDYYKKHEAMHWLPEEVTFRDDIRDWNTKLSSEEKALLTNLFRFFTQGDIDVASGYRKIFMPALGNHPEVAMMLSSFANREAVHVDAYATLIETLGMPEETYREFMNFKEMQDKHDYISGLSIESPVDFLLGLAIYSAFTEGMQLFSSFAILMNFERHGKLKDMANIVRWSIRDESMHVEGMIKLFQTLRDELQLNPSELWQLKEDIRNIAIQMTLLEDRFIDLCFSQGGIEGLTADEVKAYIRFTVNKRWEQLGEMSFDFRPFPSGEYDENPLGWLDWVLNGNEHTNFFEAQATEYSKGTLQGDMDDVEW